MDKYITSNDYITLVAAAINGLAQNPAILQFADPYQIQQVVVAVMQGTEQAITQIGLQIIPEDIS